MGEARVIYNLVLIAFVLPLAYYLGKSDDIRFWWRVPFEAVIANICFCAGPVAEGYLCWLLGMERRLARRLLFVNGLALSLWLAYVSVRHTILWFGGGFLG